MSRPDSRLENQKTQIASLPNEKTCLELKRYIDSCLIQVCFMHQLHHLQLHFCVFVAFCLVEKGKFI